MRTAFDNWAGLASYVEGWFQQDATEREASLKELETQADLATTLTNIQGKQAAERRASSLFGPQLRAAELGVEKAEFGLGQEQAQAAERMQVNKWVQETYGMPSLSFLEQAAQAGEWDLIRETLKQKKEQEVPRLGTEAEAVGFQVQTAAGQARLDEDVFPAQARAERETARATTAKAGYERELTERRQATGVARLAVDVEKELLELAPPAKRAEIAAALSVAAKNMGALANTPEGKDAMMRLTWGELGLPYSYDQYLGMREHIKAGIWSEPNTIRSNIRNGYEALNRTIDEATTGDMIRMWMMQNMDMSSDPNLGRTMQEAYAPGLTDPEIKSKIREGLVGYITEQENLLKQHDRFMRPGGIWNRQRLDNTMSQLDTGGTAQQPTTFGDKGEGIKNEILTVMNAMDPSKWEMYMETNKAKFIQRWGSEADYDLGLRTVRRAMLEVMGQPAGVQQQGTDPLAGVDPLDALKSLMNMDALDEIEQLMQSAAPAAIGGTQATPPATPAASAARESLPEQMPALPQEYLQNHTYKGREVIVHPSHNLSEDKHEFYTDYIYKGERSRYMYYRDTIEEAVRAVHAEIDKVAEGATE